MIKNCSLKKMHFKIGLSKKYLNIVLSFQNHYLKKRISKTHVKLSLQNCFLKKCISKLNIGNKNQYLIGLKTLGM